MTHFNSLHILPSLPRLCNINRLNSAWFQNSNLLYIPDESFFHFYFCVNMCGPTCLVMFLTPLGKSIGSCSFSIESISSRPMVCSRTGGLAKEMLGVSTSLLCFEIGTELIVFGCGGGDDVDGFSWFSEAGVMRRRRTGRLRIVATRSPPLINLPIITWRLRKCQLLNCIFWQFQMQLVK